MTQERVFYLSQLLFFTDASAAVNKLTDRLINYENVDPLLIKNRQDLKNKINNLSNLLFIEGQKLNDDEMKIKKNELNALQLQLYEIDNHLTSKSKKNKQIDRKIYSLEKITKYLKSNELLIINFELGDSYYSWCITGSGDISFNKFYPLPSDKVNYGFFSLNGANQQFRNIIDYKIAGKEGFLKYYNMNSDFDSVDIERFSEELLSKYSDGMYKMILEPFEDKFTENLNIISFSWRCLCPNTVFTFKIK